MRRSKISSPSFHCQPLTDLFTRLFASLALDKSPLVPYSRDIADQRRKYGESMLRKADDHLATQRQFEEDAQAKLSSARQKRQEERDRQEALEVSLKVGSLRVIF